MSKVEKERTNATLDTVAAIADALGVSSTSLLVRADEDALNVLRLGEGVDVSDSVSTGQSSATPGTGPVPTQIHRVSFHAGISLISPSNRLRRRLHVLARKGRRGRARRQHRSTPHQQLRHLPGALTHTCRSGKRAAEVSIVHTFLRSF